MTIGDLATTVARRAGQPGGAGANLATIARVLVNKLNQIVIDGDNLPMTAATLNASGNIVTASAPVTTDSLSLGSARLNETLYIVPAGTIAALTVVFPTNALSQIGQEITLFSTQIVSALTVSAAGLTLKGTALTAMAANVPYVWRKVAASTWARIQ